MSETQLISYRDAQLLSNIGLKIATQASIQDVIVALHEQLPEIIPTHVFAVGIYEKETDILTFFGRENKQILNGYDVVNAKTQLSGWCFKYCKPIFINDIAQDFSKYVKELPQINDGLQGRESYLYVPLCNSSGETIGVVTTQNYSKNAYNEKHLVMLESMAGYIAIALQNIRMVSAIQISEDELRSMNLLMEQNVAKTNALNARLGVEKEAMNKSAIVSIGDLKGDILEVNDLFCEISKYGREELLNQNHSIVNSGYHGESFWKDMWRTIAQGKTWQGEICNRAKDGAIYWVDTVIVPFLDENGKPYQYFSLRKDITSRKQLVAELHEKEQNLSSILGSMQGLVYRCNNDRDWTLEFISSGILELSGYTPESFLSGKYTIGGTLIYEGDRDRVWDEVQLAIDKKRPFWLEYRIVTTEGVLKWVLERGKGIFRNGELLALEGFMTDVTELKLAQLQIEKAEERLKIILDAAEMFWWENNLATGKVIHDENYYYDLLGYNKDDYVVPKDIKHIMDIVHPDDRELMAEAVNAHLDGLTNFFSIEVRYRKKNGEWLWVRIRGKLVKHEEEDDLFVGITYDISKRKQRESIIREQHEELLASEEEMRQQAEELKAINENLEYTLKELKTTQNHLVESEKMAALGQLIANVAHEVNTPLGAINSSIETVNEVLANTFPKFPEFLSSLPEVLFEPFLRLVQHGLQTKVKPTLKEQREYRKILEHVLTMQKVDNGKLLAKRLVSMGVYEKIDQYIDLFQAKDALPIIDMAYQFAKMQRSAQTIRIAAERAGKVIYALKSYARHDSLGTKQDVEIHEGIDTVITLYHNLIKQGVDVVRDYELGLTAPCFPDELNQVWMNLIHNALQAMDYKGSLTIKTYKQENTAVVEIGDSGRGISPELEDDIFKAFFTTKSIGEGSGLGLNIVKRILEKHDALINFDSEINKGTVFRVSLPLNE